MSVRTQSGAASAAPQVRSTPTRAVDVDAADLEREFGLSFGSMTGITDEDLDPTPVPRGCPGCWKRGPRCTRCPR